MLFIFLLCYTINIETLHIRVCVCVCVCLIHSKKSTDFLVCNFFFNLVGAKFVLSMPFVGL